VARAVVLDLGAAIGEGCRDTFIGDPERKFFEFVVKDVAHCCGPVMLDAMQAKIRVRRAAVVMAARRGINIGAAPRC
jgi:hypothetical protein